jgi:hypothetical protein
MSAVESICSKHTAACCTPGGADESSRTRIQRDTTPMPAMRLLYMSRRPKLRSAQSAAICTGVIEVSQGPGDEHAQRSASVPAGRCGGKGQTPHLLSRRAFLHELDERLKAGDVPRLFQPSCCEALSANELGCLGAHHARRSWAPQPSHQRLHRLHMSNPSPF